jgi:hypothetical protein
MFANRSLQVLVMLAACSMCATSSSLVKHVAAAPTDVVDLDGDTHHNPPSTTPNQSETPNPATTGVPEDTPPLGRQQKVGSGPATGSTASDRARLKLRAGEDARGAAQVLGMSLQERAHDRVKVNDVAMNSPAFDAGVMKGDEILYFQGFRGETYRKWIDGMRRLTDDTAPGLKIPVVLNRDGKQVNVQIEVPARPVRPSTTRPLAQPGSSLVQPGITQPPGVPAAGGNNIVVGNSGPFVDFFGGEQAASPHDRAAAHLVRLGSPQPQNSGAPATAANPTPGATAAPINAGPRVGMAGFRDDASGMVVMVDVAALPPGEYAVSITDPSAIGGAAVLGVGPTVPGVGQPSQPTAPQTPAPRIQPAQPGGGLPAPAKGGQPQGRLQPKSTTEIPRTILAQVGATTDTVPPTGETRPSTVPPTGQATPDRTPPTGLPRANAPARAGGGTGVGTLSQLGTITVDQNGAGRLQQKVESARVRDVVGQAIVLYSQAAPPQTAVPATPGGNSPSRPGIAGPISAGNYDQSLKGGAKAPVAGGIIQLITDRRPPANIAPQATQAPAATNGAVEQPANATPPAGQNLVR